MATAMASCKPCPLGDIITPHPSSAYPLIGYPPPPLGFSIIAESSTGCVFAGSALGKKGEDTATPAGCTGALHLLHLMHCSVSQPVCVSGVYADKIGIEAAEMLLRNIRHNGCVDEFLQDQVGVIVGHLVRLPAGINKVTVWSPAGVT